MNVIWSKYVQNIGTLYLSRLLRFSEDQKEKYMSIFDIGSKKDILEIGCGPGAFAQSLDRWYPNAKVVGIDRDTSFIEFAAKQAPYIEFMEADAEELPFEDCVFDVTISNTVAEHIEPSKFFGEQFRVLRQGGVCLVLSARQGINIASDCVAKETDFEKEIWERTKKHYQTINEKLSVCQYPMSESELPKVMEKYGFKDISVRYLAIDLTPDDPKNSRQSAYDMINANRQSSLDAADKIIDIAPEIVKKEEIAEMKRQINIRYDKRIELYDSGVKQWDTNVSVTMIVRGVKESSFI